MSQEKNSDNKMSKIIRIIATILTIIWMIIIFSFSAQPSEASSASSMSTSIRLVETTNRIFGFNWQDSKIIEIANSIEGLVRKLAHMTEYGILALFGGVALGAWKNKNKKLSVNRNIILICICAMYAASDEIHQLFVPGRNGAIKDVIIDIGGSAITMLIGICVKQIRKKRTKSEE